MESLFDGLPAEEASARNGYARNTIDRRSEKRGADSLATALADPSARLYLFLGDKALLRGTNPLFSHREAAALGELADMILLGWSESGPRLAAALADATPIDEALIRPIDLRSLAVEGAVGPETSGRWRRRGRSPTGTSATASARSAASQPP